MTEPTQVPPAVPPYGRERRHDRFRRFNPATKYAIVVAALAALVVVALVALHAMNATPRDSLAIARRELEINVLAPGESVVSAVPVVRRQPMDYFRATHGLLVLTDKRLLYLGLRPRDLTSRADAPPTFDERDFPIDTLAGVTAGRAMAGAMHGVVVHTEDGAVRFAVPGNSWPAATRMVALMTARQATAQANGQRQGSMQKIADAEWQRAVAAWNKPQYYTVRRGDALGSIATTWNTTPDVLQQLNTLPDNRIRVGQTLLVRKAL